jgi:hypothetical protein
MARRGELKSYEGACHCGAIEFTFETRLAPGSWALRRCQCSFCRGHGALSCSDPKGTVRFRYIQPDRLRRYRFGLRTADFLICRECGMYLGAVMMTGAGAVAIVNVHTLREPPRRLGKSKKVDYKNESLEQRRVRRRGLWTPVFGPV